MFCIALSASWPANPERTRFIEDLAERLVSAGVHTLILPDLYQLHPHSDALALLKKITVPLLFGGWLRPRAAYWTLRAMGIGASAGANGQSGIDCVDFNKHSSPEAGFSEFKARFGGSFPGGAGKLIRAKGACYDRWYPVIDFKRCTGCQECAEFCLFGVYGKTDDGGVRVVNGDACKPGCPACSRVCPSQAVIFPLYQEDEAIAGAEHVAIQPFAPAELAQIQAHRQTAARAKPPGLQSSVLADSDDPRKRDGVYFDKVIGDLVKE